MIGSLLDASQNPVELPGFGASPLRDFQYDTPMTDRSDKKSRKISPFVDIGRDGAVQVRLGEYLRSPSGASQRNELRHVAEIAKGKNKAAAGS